MTRTDLIAALEAATGPSRELDAEIGVLRQGPSCDWYAEAGRIRVPGCGSISSQWLEPRRYTGSLDTALTLVEEEGAWRLYHPGYDKGILAAPYGFELHSRFSSGGGPKWIAYAPTAPIAVCLTWARSLP